MWPIPQRLCDALPELAQYGLYRKLDSGQWEFVAYCNMGTGPQAGHVFFGIYDDDLSAILNGTLPKKEAKAFQRDFAAMRALQWNLTN